VFSPDLPVLRDALRRAKKTCLPGIPGFGQVNAHAPALEGQTVP
jgi:hypothetical protein